MPIYEYLCEKCSKIFSVRMSMLDHEKERIACPECKEIRVAPPVRLLLCQNQQKELTPER